MEKILLEFKGEEFNRALKNYNRREEILSKIGDIFKELELTLEEGFEENPLGAFDIALQSKYKSVNLMKLKTEKLIFLLGIEESYEKISALYVELSSIKQTEEPKEEDFKIYISREEEIIRLNRANNLLTSLSELKKDLPSLNIHRATENLRGVYLKDSNGGLKPNPSYVKSGKVGIWSE
jgi:hypothetical protein